MSSRQIPPYSNDAPESQRTFSPSLYSNPVWQDYYIPANSNQSRWQHQQQHNAGHYGFTDGSNVEARASRGMSMLLTTAPPQILEAYEAREDEETTQSSLEAPDIAGARSPRPITPTPPSPTATQAPTPPNTGEWRNSVRSPYDLAFIVADYQPRRRRLPSERFEGPNHAPAVLPRPDPAIVRRVRGRLTPAAESVIKIEPLSPSLLWSMPSAPSSPSPSTSSSLAVGAPSPAPSTDESPDFEVELRAVEGAPYLVVDPVTGRGRKRRLMDNDPKQHRAWRRRMEEDEEEEEEEEEQTPVKRELEDD